MSDLLTILIPTMPRRKHFLDKIMIEFITQGFVLQDEGESRFKILIDESTDTSIGKKRNKMMERVKTPYVCFVDDDDMVCRNYIKLLLEGIATNPDCCSLNGIITTDGENPKVFKHSIEYDSMYEKDGIYYRMPNHLNTVRTDIARLCPFPDWHRSEDSNYAFQLQATGLLKKEYKIEETLYHYLYRTDKRALG